MLKKCNSPIDSHPFSFQDIFDCLGITFEYESSTPKSLCVTHYNSVYRHKNSGKVQTVKCCVCGIKRKHEHSSLLVTEKSKFVPCPSPKIVESFLVTVNSVLHSIHKPLTKRGSEMY